MNRKEFLTAMVVATLVKPLASAIPKAPPLTQEMVDDLAAQLTACPEWECMYLYCGKKCK